MGQVTEVGSAIFLLHCQAQQAHISQFQPQVCWKEILAVNLLCTRRNLRLGKLIHSIA